jgi:predicted RNase H-like HicB family nuclease
MKVYGPGGEVRDVDASEAARLIQTVGGWSEAPAAESGESEPVRAAAEGAARGLTLGVSDEFFAGASGAPYKGVDGKWYSGDMEIAGPDAAGALDQSSQLKQRRDENPIASGVGNVIGTVVGPGKFFKLGKTLNTAVALGAAEGSMLGLGAAISEDALGDKEALGEKLLANVGFGTLAGGASGALGLGLTRGADAISRKLANYTLDVDAKALSKLGSDVRGGSYKQAAEKAGLDWDYVDKVAKEEGIFTARSTPENVVEMAKAAQQRARAEVLKNVEDVAGPGGLFDLDAVAEGLAKEGQDIAKGFKKADRSLGSAFEMEAAAMRSDARGAPTWDSWVDAVSSKLSSGSAVERRVGKKMLDLGIDQLEFVDKTGAYRVADALSREQAAAFLAGKVRGAARTSINEAVMAGAYGGLAGGPLTAAAGAGSALLGGEIRARAPFLTAAALENLGPGLVRAANGFQARVAKVLQTAPELLGPYRAVLTQAMAEGAPELLRTHTELASGANGGDYLSRLGMEHEGPDESAAAASRAAVYDTLESQARKVDERLERWAGRMTGGVSGPAPTPTVKTPKDWEKRLEDIRATAMDPERYLASIPSEMMDNAPATTMALASMTTKAAEYLLAKAPKNPYVHLPENLRPKWLPSPGELSTFEAAASGIEDPLAALERMQRGYTNPETLRAIADVYPRLWEDARARLFDRVATSKNLSYEQRLRLEPILGPIATGSTREQAAYLQQMHDKQRMPPQAGGASPDGRQVVSTTKNLDTQAQRLEARGARTS